MLRLQHFLLLLKWFVVIEVIILSLRSTIDIIFIMHQLQEIMLVLKNVGSLGLLNSYKPKTTAQVLVSWELDMTFWPSAAVTHPRWSCMKIPITAFSIIMDKLPNSPWGNTLVRASISTTLLGSWSEYWCGKEYSSAADTPATVFVHDLKGILDYQSNLHECNNSLGTIWSMQQPLLIPFYEVWHSNYNFENNILA